MRKESWRGFEEGWVVEEMLRANVRCEAKMYFVYRIPSEGSRVEALGPGSASRD